MNSSSPVFRIYQVISGKLPLLIGQLFLWLCLASAAQAATFKADPTATDEVDVAPGDGNCLTVSGKCSLRAAIMEANALSGSDIIDLPAGTYTLTIGGTGEDQAATGDLDITDSVTITGADKTTTIIDGNNLDRVFHITKSGIDVTISKVTIENGHLDGGFGGGIYNNGGTVSIDDSIITSNTLKNPSTSSVVSAGGGVFNSGTLSLNNVTVSNNVVDINSNGNSGGGGGGGIYSTNSLDVENSTIDGNKVINDVSSNNGGGGIQITGVSGTGPNTTKAVIVRSTISNNAATLGGGVRNLFGHVDMDLSVIDSNSASLSGGGVQNADGGMSILRSTVRNNIAKQTGGGVDNLGALSISGTSIYSNQSVGINAGAGGAGGGVSNGGNGEIDMINTTISGNQARAGGGLYNHKDINVTNSTIFDNSLIDSLGNPVTVPAAGTEVFACGSGDAENTSTCNTAITDGSGNIIIHTNFINTIIGNSTTTDNCDGDVKDLIISKGNNIEAVNPFSSAKCGLSNNGDQTVLPATVFSNVFGFYGGDLASLNTLPISSGSPAYNAGDNTSCPATDGRNYDRNDGQCDIGAYEFGASPSTSNVLDLALDINYGVGAPLNGSVQTTITYVVANKGPLQATNVVLTGSIPLQSWLKIISLDPRCTVTTTGFTCSGLTIDAYTSANIFVAVLATQAGKFTVSGYVQSNDQAENYNPDNSKSVTVDIPTVAGSSASGNNFAGATGGGAMDWLSLLVLLSLLARSQLYRNKSG